MSDQRWLEYDRGALGGVLMALMMVTAALSAFVDGGAERVWLACSGLSAWGAAAVLWSRLSVGLRWMALALVLVGVVAGAVADVDPLDMGESALSRNVGILCMLVAVGFLRLVPLAAARKAVVQGPRAWRDTLLATALFGSVINISALLIIADDLRARGGGNAFAVQSLTRVFTASAAWSPFFAGMAVVVESVPGVSVFAAMAGSLPYAIVAMLLTWAWGHFGRQDDVQHFLGFPLQAASLMLPALLTVLVLLSFLLMPDLSIVVAIALSALAACAVFLGKAFGWAGAVVRMREHVTSGMARGVNELVLFLAAGVLSVGLAALFDSGIVQLPTLPYDWRFASAVLGGILVAAMLGVHPVVSVSGLAPALLTLSPPPVMVALTFLFGWSLGTSISPLSATLLTVQGRYGLPGWRVALANGPFAAVLFGVAVCSFYVIDTVILAA